MHHERWSEEELEEAWIPWAVDEKYGTLERVLAPFVRGDSVGSVILSQKLIYGIKMYRVKGLGNVWKLWEEEARESEARDVAWEWWLEGYLNSRWWLLVPLVVAWRTMPCGMCHTLTNERRQWRTLAEHCRLNWTVPKESGFLAFGTDIFGKYQCLIRRDYN